VSTKDIAARIQELSAEVKRLNDAYYGDGDSPFPDADYDALKDELTALVAEHPELEPSDSPLGKVNAPEQLQGPTVRHARPMLSLAKATTEEAIVTFCERFPGQVFRVSEKLDGLSISIVYEHGKLDYVATRGTGTIGEIVTDKAIHVIPELPRTVKPKGRVEVRGEALMARSTWQAYNDTHPDKPLTNPRNGAAGTLMQKDARAAAEAGRLLRFFAFGAEHDGADVDPERLGFELVHQTLCDTTDAVMDAIHAIGARRDALDYDIDGAVVRLHEPAAFEAAGFNSAEPRGAIAFKYPPEEKLTKLLAVEWQVGKVGRIAPRAKVEPVFVGGVTVENITLHNPRLIRERDLRIGDTIAVVRRGDVIPFAGRSIPEDRDGTEEVIVPPKYCPSCATELEIRGTGEERWCPNLQCPAQITRRLMHWASRPAADMEGVGDVWIEKLAEDGVLKSRADFYTKITTDLLLDYERMGEVSARNMVDSIAESKGLGLRRALIGFAIPMASDGTAKRLCLAGFERIEEIAAASVDELVAIKDIGPKVAESLVAFFQRPEVDQEIAELRAAGVDLTVHDEDRPVDVAAAGDSPLKGKTVVITGAFTDPRSGAKVSRPDVTRLVEQAAATATSSVSGDTDYLLAGANTGAAKTNKADKLGVQVVDQETLWAWLAEAGVA